MFSDNDNTKIYTINLTTFLVLLKYVIYISRKYS